MKKIFILSALFLATVPLQLSAKVIDRVVAVVNDEVITLYDWDRAMAVFSSQGEKSEDFRRHVLEKLIDQKLLEQEMKKSKVEVTPEELSRAIASVLSRNQISVEQLQVELAGKGISFEAFKKQLGEEVRQAKFIQQNLASQVQLNSQEIKEFQNRNKGSSGDVSVRLGWFFFPFENNMDAKERRKLVLRARKFVDEGRKINDFGHFAKERCHKKRGEQYGEWSKSFKELPLLVIPVVQEMTLDSLSDPIVSPEGIYVVKLYEKSAVAKTEQPVLDEESIRQKLYQEKLDQEIQNYVLRLRRKSYIEIKE